MLDIIWMILKLCLPWFILSFVGNMVKTHLYMPYMKKKEQQYGAKLSGFTEKLLIGFISFLVIGTLFGLNLLPQVAKDSVIWFLYYILTYSSPIMVVLFIVMIIKTKSITDSLLLTLIIFGMGILILPYTYLMVMKRIGKYVLSFLGITFEEAVNDMANSGNTVWQCPNCGAQIYQTGNCQNCDTYVTIAILM